MDTEPESSELGFGLDLDVHPVASSSRQIQLNDYKGYEPPLGLSFSIDRVSADISPGEFYDKYIRRRRPAIIEQHLTDASWKASQWSDKYLEEKAGQAQVLVEKRGDGKESMFGLSAPKVDMKYGEFLQLLRNDNEQYYMTTQDLERFQEDLDDFDMPKSVLAEPLKLLKDDFPLCPSLLGKLVPYQVSLWQGNATHGTSSGLHHDFHDNLYVLLRGRKRFRLFPPSLAPHMNTMGQPIKVHPNGLIVYQLQAVNPTVNIRADGVPLAFLARRKRIEAEQELAIAEEEMYSIQDTAEIPESEKNDEIKRLQGIILDCEDRIDLAMEEMLQYGNTFDYDYNSDADVISVHGDDSELDADDSSDERFKNGVKKKGNGDHADHPPTKIMKLSNGSRAVVNPNTDSNGEGSEKLLKIPDHFCNVVLPTDTDNPDKILSKFADQERIRGLSVEVKAGEMLYLPASWFHEVTSYTDSRPQSGEANKDSSCCGHLALNYWMFPPDGERFDCPYRDDFWPKRWKAIQEEKDSIFTLGSRSNKYRKTADSEDVINLDSESDDDYDSSGSIDAILVGEDSLHDSTTDSDDPIVIETQMLHSPPYPEGVIELDVSDYPPADVSCDENRSTAAAAESKDPDCSLQDGIVNSGGDVEAPSAESDNGNIGEESEKLEEPNLPADSSGATPETANNDFVTVDSNLALENTEIQVCQSGGSEDRCLSDAAVEAQELGDAKTDEDASIAS